MSEIVELPQVLHVGMSNYKATTGLLVLGPSVDEHMIDNCRLRAD